MLWKIMVSRKSQVASRRNVFFAALSAVLLILSFPGFNFEFLAWVALVPLLFAIENKSPLKSFLNAYIAGVLFFLGTIYWLIHVTLPGMIVVVLYLALSFGLFGFLASYRISIIDYRSIFYIPAAWVATELIRSQLFGGFGWVLLAHSQSYNLPAIQIADITGAYGVSFLIVMVNTTVYLTIKEIKNRNYAFTHVAVTLVVIFLSLGYGTYRVKNIFTGERLRVAVVQGNIPQAEKWDANFRGEILNKYESLTRQAAKDKVDLVIWPETSVPGFLEAEQDLTGRMESLAKSINTPILAGAPAEDLGAKDAYYNSAILLSEKGRIAGRYDKMHLVPFGEYVPFKKMLSFVERFARSPIGDFSKGTKPTVFQFFIERGSKEKNVSWKLLKKVKFSCLICFEDIFPGIARRFVNDGALFLVNITNDAWFGRSSAAYQHAQSSVFRAVENRVNVVRAANTGLSCFIDQKGRIVSEVGSGGRELFIDGFNIHDIVLTKTRTLYSVYGDLFAYICVLFVILSILNPPLRNPGL